MNNNLFELILFIISKNTLKHSIIFPSSFPKILSINAMSITKLFSKIIYISFGTLSTLFILFFNLKLISFKIFIGISLLLILFFSLMRIVIAFWIVFKILLTWFKSSFDLEEVFLVFSFNDSIKLSNFISFSISLTIFLFLRKYNIWFCLSKNDLTDKAL